MQKGYLKRVLHLVAICCLFLYLIMRVALRQTPEEDARGRGMIAQYGVSKGGINVASEFEYTFYRVLEEKIAKNDAGIRAGSYVIETGRFESERLAKEAKRGLIAKGHEVRKQRVAGSYWILRIGRYGSKELAEKSFKRLLGSSVKLPGPLEVRGYSH